MPNLTLDTTGLSCPIPILKTKKVLATLAAGATLEVISTDPAAPKDFAAFCRATGNALLDSGVRGDAYWFLIERTG